MDFGDASSISRVLDEPAAALIGVGPDGLITLTADVGMLFGYRDEELLAQPLSVIVDNPQGFSAGNTGRTEVEACCRRKDGTRFLAEVSLSKVHSQSGTQVWAAVREAPLCRRTVVTRNLFASIAESSSDAIISTTPDGIITYWNPAAKRLYGYTADEMIGRSVALLYVTESLGELGELMQRVTRGGPVRLDRVPRRRKDGSIVRATVTISPITDATGAIVGAASVTRDVGSDQRAEAKFQALLEAATVAIVGVTEQGRILLVNAEAERLFGYPRGELIGQPIEILVPENHRVTHARHRHGYMAMPRTRPMGAGLALSAERKDGSQFPVEIALSTIDTDDGLLVAAAIRDLTQQVERERLEQQLQQIRRLDSLGQLAGGVAHDFNNLMGIIDGYASFIQEDADAATDDPSGLPATIVEHTQKIREAVTRASLLTRQLLAFGRREITRPQVLDINATIRDTSALLHRTLGEHIDIELRLADDACPTMADPGQIEQIIINAAVNARDAMPGGGTLSIDTTNIIVDETHAERRGATPGRYLRLRIADTGIGMDKDVAAHAFEPFFTTKPQGSGTGLGLSTIYGITTGHGGHAAIYSEPGHGTTLTILLPIHDDLSRQDTTPARPEHADTDGGDPARYTILVVDDEEGLRDVVHRILARAGHTVLVATDGLDALAIANGHPGPIDLLLADVIMPKMLGKELAQQLLASRPGLRVLFMSGYAQPALNAQGTLDPGTVLLEKPFTERQLQAAINVVMHTQQHV